MHMRHPDFRAEGKIFATLGYPDDKHGMVKLTPEQQKRVIKQEPEAFWPCAGRWGKRGATQVFLEKAKVGVLRNALGYAWGNLTKQAVE